MCHRIFRHFFFIKLLNVIFTLEFLTITMVTQFLTLNNEIFSYQPIIYSLMLQFLARLLIFKFVLRVITSMISI